LAAWNCIAALVGALPVDRERLIEQQGRLLVALLAYRL
jgi:hypothetical protein